MIAGDILTTTHLASQQLIGGCYYQALCTDEETEALGFK